MPFPVNDAENALKVARHLNNHPKVKWVNYAGQIGEQDYSITVMDHPSSFRAPTTWHAREYGLIAANPFGLSYFQKKPKGSGDLKLAPGEAVTFRYGVLLARGAMSKAEIKSVFEQFSKE